jgi:hypothetical protein
MAWTQVDYRKRLREFLEKTSSLGYFGFDRSVYGNRKIKLQGNGGGWKN